jgi:hypothetical protein
MTDVKEIRTHLTNKLDLQVTVINCIIDSKLHEALNGGVVRIGRNTLLVSFSEFTDMKVFVLENYFSFYRRPKSEETLQSESAIKQ